VDRRAQRAVVLPKLAVHAAAVVGVAVLGQVLQRGGVEHDAADHDARRRLVRIARPGVHGVFAKCDQNARLGRGIHAARRVPLIFLIGSVVAHDAKAKVHGLARKVLAAG
jgi:hypothetical protein